MERRRGPERSNRSEQMGVDWLRQTRPNAIGRDHLLNATRCEGSAARALEQGLVLGTRLPVDFQDEPEAGWKQNRAVLRSLALLDEDAAML
jgi:hypothetical protein